MARGKRGKDDVSDNMKLTDMFGGGQKPKVPLRTRGKEAASPSQGKAKAKKAKRQTLAGKRKRGARKEPSSKRSKDSGEEEDSDEVMSEAGDDSSESSSDENPAPRKAVKRSVGRKQPGRGKESKEDKEDKDLLAELGISDDDDDDDNIAEILNTATIKRGRRIQNTFSKILNTREEEMDVQERDKLLEMLARESDDDEEGEKGEDGELASMRVLGGAAQGLQSQRLMDVLNRSGGDVQQIPRFNFVKWCETKPVSLDDAVIRDLYEVLSSSPSVVAPGRKRKQTQGLLTPECSFLATSGWLQLYRKELDDTAAGELCTWLFRIVTHCEEAHTRASAYHLLDAIIRDEDVVELSSVADYAPSMMIAADSWVLPYDMFLRCIEGYGMDISSFIPQDPDDDASLLEMGTVFSQAEPGGAEFFPQKNVLLVIRLLDSSVNAKPDHYSQEELVSMVSFGVCFLLDPWLQKGILAIESFVTSCLNAFSARQWKNGAAAEICQRLCDPTILADETQLVGALRHIAISKPRKGAVDRGRLIKGHTSVMALCGVLGMDVPEMDRMAFPPVDVVVSIVEKIKEDAANYTDAVKAKPGEKKRDYTRLYAMLCLLDTAIDKRLYEAEKQRSALTALTKAIRNLDARIKDKGGVLHVARKRVKEKLLTLQCTVELLLI